ncbi:MAG: hypothetical protein KDD62_05105 [Bdellovibrionales bacterium]|nr:hypothetical protein [Bdellovibrionales bacterium]
MNQSLNSVSHAQEIIRSDPSWERAFKVAEARLQIPQNISQLLRASWRDSLSLDEFTRLAGFCQLNFDALIEFAGDAYADYTDRVTKLRTIISDYGTRHAAVVLGINYTCRTILASNPPPIWRSLMKELIDTVHIGQIFGSKVEDVGVESGMLMGFARSAGLSILMSFDPSTFRKWYSLSQGYEGRKLVLETFGCEPYQVAGAALQLLGYGPEMAIGAGLAMGNLNIKKIELGEAQEIWHACYLWIDSLREGRSYPGPMESRNFFPEVVPPRTKGKRNPTLEVMYTEISRVKRSGSPWKWHLTGIKEPK